MTERPSIFDFGTPAEFVRAMLEWKQAHEPGFSIRQALQRAPGCSPALVTQVVRERRRLTRDRVPAFSQMLGLNREETKYLDEWVAVERSPVAADEQNLPRMKIRTRATPANHILKDWLNVYVKDAARLEGFEPNAKVIHKMLGGIASLERIQRSLDYLLAEGFFRKKLNGEVVLNELMTVTSDGIPSEKIRAFHKQALEIAKRNIDLVPVEKRRASALVLALDKEGFEELRDMLQDFHRRVESFAAKRVSKPEQLYQLVMNLSPMGSSK